MEFIEIATPDGPMRTASAVPAGEAKGAIVVIQEAFGLTEHICELTDRLAAVGYRAIAPALFHRAEKQQFAYDDFDSVLPAIQGLDADEIRADLDIALALLATEGFDKAATGVVGFCMGGSLALFSATRPGVGAAVSFYGGGVIEGRFGIPPLVDLAPSIRCPWLGLYGDLDQSIPIEQVEALRAAASSARATSKIVRYSDAGHGFHCNDRPDHFNAEAAADAWNSMVAFFDENLRR